MASRGGFSVQRLKWALQHRIRADAIPEDPKRALQLIRPKPRRKSAPVTPKIGVKHRIRASALAVKPHNGLTAARSRSPSQIRHCNAQNSRYSPRSVPLISRSAPKGSYSRTRSPIDQTIRNSRMQPIALNPLLSSSNRDKKLLR